MLAGKTLGLIMCRCFASLWEIRKDYTRLQWHFVQISAKSQGLRIYLGGHTLIAELSVKFMGIHVAAVAFAIPVSTHWARAFKPDFLWNCSAVPACEDILCVAFCSEVLNCKFLFPWRWLAVFLGKHNLTLQKLNIFQMCTAEPCIIPDRAWV